MTPLTLDDIRATLQDATDDMLAALVRDLDWMIAAGYTVTLAAPAEGLDGLRDAVIHAARDVDGLWFPQDDNWTGTDLTFWGPEAGEALRDLRDAVKALYDAEADAPILTVTTPDGRLDVAERRRLAGALANWALSPGESFRTLLPYLGLAYAEAYREGWMVFTNAINERLNRAEAAPAEGLDVERMARALCRNSGYVWSNEPEWQREEWRGKARKLLRVLCDIDRELAALEANHE